MSDKELVINTVKELPEDVTLEEIRERLELIAGLRAAEQSLDQGKGIPHEEVKKQFES